MVLLSVTSAKRYDFGSTPYADEIVHKASKPLLLKPGSAALGDATWPPKNLAHRGKITDRRVATPHGGFLQGSPLLLD